MSACDWNSAGYWGVFRLGLVCVGNSCSHGCGEVGILLPVHSRGFGSAASLGTFDLARGRCSFKEFLPQLWKTSFKRLNWNFCLECVLQHSNFNFSEIWTLWNYGDLKMGMKIKETFNVFPSHSFCKLVLNQIIANAEHEGSCNWLKCPLLCIPQGSVFPGYLENLDY